MKLSNILGLNARTQLFTYKYNTRRGRNIANSKIQTARILKSAGVLHPKIFAKFKDPSNVFDFDWQSLPDKFALKPSRGFGGEGIIVAKKKLKDGSWLTTQKERITADDLKLHTLDILEGAYSMGNVPDVAFIQDYVGRHKAFRRWAYRGTPDIRIIIFNKVPIMAMLRLPTKESGGRANLHQGALGVGVDIATGITTRAIWNDQQIVFKPGTTKKLRGIKIPNWTSILETAVNAQIASGLGYIGVDMVLDPEKGPMVLELNAQPGLGIQLANMEGLKSRLDRVDDLEVKDAEHGVKIAKALFAGRFASRVNLEEGIKTIKAVEKVKVLSSLGKKVEVLAKIDTGAWSSAIDADLARELGIFTKSKVLFKKKKLSALGEEERPVIPMTFWLAGNKISTKVTVADRSDLRYQVLIGRIDLNGFLVSPEIDQENLREAKWN
ncbi:MAG TPA: sugar-transfer associated ATP-grasp domain-containing protein [Alphaproteobacteria bacterium]|jgi:alpha-L-glutamate ligase-like protein|nr:sugar-transfer associated ATP-grasp domain-containing protein [Alphaproteobacteria bacterium]